MIGTILGGTGCRYEKVLKLLDQERAVLLAGPLDELGPLVERREALLAELLAKDRAAPEAFLTALKAKAERNGRLLLASIAGLKAARHQMESMRAARESLRTYTAAGASVDVAGTSSTRDQRR